MKVLAVDPDPVELIRLSESLRITTPAGTSVECFCDPLFVYQYTNNVPVDALFAVADMKRLSGFNMAKQLRKENPQLQVYFLWHNDELYEDAIHAGADGYLIKPVTPEKLRQMAAALSEPEGFGEADGN